SLTPPHHSAIYPLSLHDALPIFECLTERRIEDGNGEAGRLWFQEARARPGLKSRDVQLRARRGELGATLLPQFDRGPLDIRSDQIGRAHVRTPVTWPSRMPSSA